MTNGCFIEYQRHTDCPTNELLARIISDKAGLDGHADGEGFLYLSGCEGRRFVRIAISVETFGEDKQEES